MNHIHTSKLLCSLLLLSFQFTLRAQAWEKRADIPVKLAFPVVVSLNGYIHVMGGGTPAGATDIHLRYDPSTDKWDTMAPVPYKAQQPAGAVVRGKIHYFGGGFPNSGTRLNKHYIYYPDSNAWKQAANLPQARAIHKAAGLDGKLYSMGGQQDKFLNEMYDPDSNKWYTKKPLPDQNFWYGAVVVTGEQMYRFGGGGYSAPVGAAHQYNTSADSWTLLPDLTQSVHAIAAAGFGDSAIYLAGGYSGGTEINKMWIYDIKKQSYYNGTPMPAARTYHSMVTVGACIYSVGGNNDADSTVEVSLMRYCPPGFRLSADEACRAEVINISACEDRIIIRTDPLHPLTQSVLINIFDLAGKQVYAGAHIPDNMGIISVSSQEFNKGYHLIHLRSNGKSWRGKVMLNTN